MSVMWRHGREYTLHRKAPCRSTPFTTTNKGYCPISRTRSRRQDRGTADIVRIQLAATLNLPCHNPKLTQLQKRFEKIQKSYPTTTLHLPYHSPEPTFYLVSLRNSTDSNLASRLAREGIVFLVLCKAACS